jgi:hypothetical protein
VLTTAQESGKGTQSLRRRGDCILVLQCLVNDFGGPRCLSEEDQAISLAFPHVDIFSDDIHQIFTLF